MSSYIGIDFGTSNCCAAYWVNGAAKLIRLDENADDPFKIRSSIYAKKREIVAPKPTEAAIQKMLTVVKRDLNTELSQLRQQLQEQKTAIDKKNKQRRDRVGDMPIDASSGSAKVDALEGLVVESLERNIDSINSRKNDEATLLIHAERLATQNLMTDDQTLSEVLANDQIFFGADGFNQYLEQGSERDEGIYFASPKNFLGSKLAKEHLNSFELVVTRMLSYIKTKSELEVGESIEKAVIAVPVEYHGTAGNEQAIEIMKSASAKAGFTAVEFIFEPIAASLHFETKLVEPETVIIVDIGGGTTDVTVCDLNPEKLSVLKRDDDIHSVCGLRKGGIAADKLLGIRSVASAFGRGSKYKDGKPLENAYFSGMFSIDDVNELNAFYKKLHDIKISMTRADKPELLERLVKVVTGNQVFRLMNSIEQAKILLSGQEEIELPFEYIEKGMNVGITVDELSRAIDSWIVPIIKLINKALKESSKQPTTMLLTGGMSMSPVVQAILREEFPTIAVSSEDEFSSITLGAARMANQLYGSPSH